MTAAGVGVISPAMKAFSALAAAAVFAAPAFAQTPPVKAVLLDDLSIVEGTFEEFNGVVRVTPATGTAKLLIPKQITHVAESREKVYDFVAGRIDTTTADGAKKLAGWCEKVGMTDRALTHAKAAAALAPTDAGVREMVARLEKAVAKPRTEAKAAPAKPAAVARQAQVPDLPTESAITFVAKVQPILLNQCANCHGAKGHAGAFKLARIPEGYANPEANAANLKAAAGQINREAPANSPLLTYALTAHGGQKAAAFGDRQRPPFQHVEAWVLAAVPSAAPSKGFATPTPAPMSDADPATGLPGTVVGSTGQPVAAKPAPAAPPAAAVPTAKPDDPFDPARFNALPRKADR